jgi:FecR-like protein
MVPWTTAALLLASAMLIANPAAAQEVGTATAVNPTSESTPPGGSTQTITIGAHVLHKERIHTSPSGSVQLLFLDKSSLSIAPNTSIVIDEFIYDPNSGKGHMLTTLTQGALRYVGGELSHQGEATIKTANATIGIRGGTATVGQGSGGTTVINHYGSITISNSGGTIVVNLPGYEVTITGWTIPPGQPTKVTDAEILHYLALLTSKPGQNGGGQFSGLGSFACGSPGTPACPEPPWFSTNTGQDNANQIIVQGTHLGTGQTPPTTHSGGGGGDGHP